MSVRAGILVTGTEVLSGAVVDRNGPWVSQRLGERGVEVAHVLCVGDRPEDLAGGMRFLAAEGAELIVTSGGLGPTADDLTAEVVAGFAGREMLLDEDLERRIGRILDRFARSAGWNEEALRAANRKQAMVPRGATPLGPAGTAPGLVVPIDGGPVVIVLPGPPRELQELWEPALETDAVTAVMRRAEPYESVKLRLFGIPESEIAQSLREVESGGVDLAPLEITTCLRQGELEVDVRHRAEGRATREALVEALAERHGEYLYSRDGSTIDEQLAKLLSGHQLGVAESCTGGMLASRLTSRPGASSYIRGGVVAYSNDAKTDILGVPAELVEAHGAVSPEVAESMAASAIDRFDADLGVAITGIAGPDGGTPEKPVGYVCVCVKAADGRTIARDPVIPGNRTEVRERATLLAMHLMRRLLHGENLPG